MKTLSQNKSSLFLTTLLLGLAACTPQNQQHTNNLKGANGVINGVPVEETDVLAKSTVYLQTIHLDDKGNTLGGGSCTATLIAENLLVTAAHCVPGPQDKNHRMVVAFKRDLEAATQADLRLVKNFVAHPSYNSAIEDQAPLAGDSSSQGTEEGASSGEDTPSDNAFDIAFVSFVGTIPKGYAPAKILMDTLKLTANAEVTVSGYGLTKWEGDLQESSTILRKGPAIFLGFANPYEAVLDQSQNKTGGGACKGDSGGPASIVVNGEEYVWGVTSRGGNPDDETKPCNGLVIYTNIASHEQFMKVSTDMLLTDLNESQTPSTGLPTQAAAN